MVPEFLLPAHSHFLRKTHTTNPVLRHKQNHTSDGTIGGSRERRFQRLHKIKKIGSPRSKKKKHLPLLLLANLIYAIQPKYSTKNEHTHPNPNLGTIPPDGTPDTFFPGTSGFTLPDLERIYKTA